MIGEDQKLANLDSVVEEAEAGWAEEISSAARWPVQEEFKSKDEFIKAVDDFHEYLYGEEARQMSRILFQIKSAPVDTVEAMQSLIDGHNQQVQEDIEEQGYDHRTGVNKDRLRQARMIKTGETEILLSAVSRHGAGVMHVSAYWRLLVRISNQNRVNDTADALAAAGLIRIKRGANNAKLVFSDGALEAAHRNYLETIRTWMKEQLF